jgi:Gpi18-like mannosyltransferase
VTIIVLVGIVLSHISHILSTLVLYALIRRLASLSSVELSLQRRIAFLSAALHVLSPAGVFLSAPYAEASFALASFTGYYCYVASWTDNRSQTKSWALIADVWTVAAGICFAIATLFRSNGLFCGLIFAYDALLWVVALCNRPSVSRLIVPLIGAAGIVLAIAVAYAQNYGFISTFDLQSTGQILASSMFLLLPGSILYNQSYRLRGIAQIVKTDLNHRQRVSIFSTIVAGSCIAAAFVWPQYVAYQEFCVESSDRASVPWCTDLPPSIYTSVQARYW